MKRERNHIQSLNLDALFKNPKNEKKCGLIWCGEDDWHKHPKRSHPERPDRIGTILKQLNASGLIEQCVPINILNWNKSEQQEHQFCESKELDELLSQVHNPYYLTRFSSKRFSKLAKNDLYDDSLSQEANQYDSVYLAERSGDAARRAVGASISLAEALVNNEIKNGFAIIRPPGHHAEPCCAKGFCLFNNIGVVASYLIKNKQEKVLIVDWDIHHGNGTATMFENKSNPCYISIHRHDQGRFFPGSSTSTINSGAHPASADAIGREEGVGHNINIAWNGSGAGDEEYRAAFEQVVLPIAKDYEPTVILVSAGFDAALGDRIGGCSVTPDGFASMTNSLCHKVPSAKGRVLLFLEGGYLLSILPDCASKCLETLIQSSSFGPAPSSNVKITQSEHDNKPIRISPEHCYEHPNIAKDCDTNLNQEGSVFESSKTQDDVSGVDDVDLERGYRPFDWRRGLLPSAVRSIEATLAAHQPHWPRALA